MHAAGSASTPARSALGAQAITVGDWQVEPALNRIRRGAETVHLEPRAMDVLLLLAARPGEVISREDLLAAAWKGSVVGDDTLTQAVIKLRKALGDDSRAPAYIETVAKRGYRLVAAVRAGETAGEAPPAATPPRRRRRVWLAALGALLLVGLPLLYYAVSGRQALPDPPAVETAALERLPTLMVRPFESLGEGTTDYLAPGITADLATDLAQLGELRVIRAPLDAALAPAERSRLARYLVSGSVQRGSGRLRVNVWLVDAASGRQLWSERYERAPHDLLAIQEDIVAQLVRALPLHVGEAELRRLAMRHTRNLEAYDLFLRAYAAHLTHQPEDNRAARALYRQAIALDPSFARAYAGLAMTHADDYRYQWSVDGPEALKRALALANSARQIDAGLREVYWVLAYVHMQWGEPRQAIRHLKRAIALDPSYADAYAYMGAVYAYSGQPERAVPLLRHGMRLNPDAGYLYYMSLGEAYLFMGDAEQARLNLDEALARNPANLETRIMLAAAHAAAGDAEAAAWEAEEIRLLAPGFSLAAWLETSPLARGPRRRVVDLLRPYGLSLAAAD